MYANIFLCILMHLRNEGFSFSLLQICFMISLYRRFTILQLLLYWRCIWFRVFLHTSIPRITKRQVNITCRRKKDLCVCECIIVTYICLPSRWTKQSHDKYSRLKSTDTTTTSNIRTHGHDSPFETTHRHIFSLKFHCSQQQNWIYFFFAWCHCMRNYGI